MAEPLRPSGGCTAAILERHSPCYAWEKHPASHTNMPNISALQVSGLASGLDWKSLVSQLIAVERVPQNALRSQQALAQQKSTVLDTLGKDLTALQDSLTAISSSAGDIFAARTANIADSSSGWTASADSASEVGSHTVNVTQLATKAQLLGGAGTGNALSATTDVSGLTIGTLPIGTAITTGEFTVNGARVSVAATDSLQDVLDRVSTATGGAVTASYDPALDKIRLSSTSEIVLGSANDTSNFLTATGLNNNGTGNVLSPKALGVVGVSKAIANANLRTAVTAVDGSGSGSFSINGVSISYNVNTESISAILARINASTAGVTASYDRFNDRFTLTNKTTGDTGIAVSEASGGLLGALGLGSSSTLSRGKNAQFTVDGGPTLSSASNTLDANAHGIAGLSMTVASLSTQTVSVAGDTSGVRTKVEDFIAKFNAVESYIDQQTAISTGSNGKVTSALFAGNHDIGAIGASLRKQVFGAVPGLSGSIKRLADIGIDFTTGTNQLAVKDSAKLDAAISGHADDVRTLFSHSTDGIVTRLNTFITQVTGSSGIISKQTSSLASQSTSLNTQIAAMERHITQQQTMLTNSFVQMETAQSAIQSQLSALNSAFGLNSSSSK